MQSAVKPVVGVAESAPDDQVTVTKGLVSCAGVISHGHRRPVQIEPVAARDCSIDHQTMRAAIRSVFRRGYVERPVGVALSEVQESEICRSESLLTSILPFEHDSSSAGVI